MASSSSPLCTSSTLAATRAGSTVTLTAGSGCLGTPEYRYFVRFPGALGYTPVTDYIPSATFDWDASGQPAGRYYFLVYVRETGSAARYESYVTTTELVGNVCTTAALGVTPGTGTTVDFAASATCAAGTTPEFRFLVRAPGAATYTEVRPYDAAPTFSWDYAGRPAGRYELLVYARAAGNASPYEAYAVQARTLGAVCTAATLTAAPGAGGDIDLSASASCTGGATPEYRLLYRAPGTGGFTEIRPYATAASHTWSTAGLPAGKYDLVAYTRAAGNASSYEALGTTNAMLGAVCTSARLTATPSADGVDLAATSVCGAGATPEYRFMVRPPGGGTLVEVRPYGETSTTSLSTAGLPSGLYEFSVLVRASGNGSAYEATGGATRAIGTVCTAATLAVTAGTGAVVDLRATATCSDGTTPEYRFLVRPPGSAAFTELRAFGLDAAYALDTATVAAGTYTFAVYARVAGNASRYESYAAKAYTIVH